MWPLERTMCESFQCWNHVSYRKVTLGDRGNRQGWVKDIDLYSRPALVLWRVPTEKLIYTLWSGTVRSNTRTWLDKNCKSTEIKRRADRHPWTMGMEIVDPGCGWKWACEPAAQLAWLSSSSNPQFIPSLEGSKLQCFSNTFQIYIIF